MRESKDLIGKSVISVSDGRLLGTVRDIYLDQNLYWMTGIHLGSEGLLKRKALVIARENVVVFGIDAVLVKNADVVTDNRTFAPASKWLRLDDLKGREIDTPGGTKVATVGDVILDEEARVISVKLSRTYVEGPIAEKRIVPRDAIIDTGQADGVMTIDLVKAEGADPAEVTAPPEADPDPEVVSSEKEDAEENE